MIGKFLSGLSDNGKKLLFVTVVVMVIALFDRLLVDPSLARIAAINEDIEKEKQSIKRDLQFLGYKNKIMNESRAFDAYMPSDIPGEEEVIAAFLKEIEFLANKASVTIAKVTPSAGSEMGEYIMYQADLECSGSLANITSFMHLVDSAQELIKVVKFSLSSKKTESDDLKASMTIKKIIIGKRAAQTKTTANGANASSQTMASASPNTP